MYSITNIIYGVPIEVSSFDDWYSEVEAELKENEKYPRALEKLFCAEDFDLEEKEGVLRYYHGGGDIDPRAFGIEIGSFDECNFSIDIKSLQLKASKEVKEKYKQLFNSLTEQEQYEVSVFGKPRVFFLFSSS